MVLRGRVGLRSTNLRSPRKRGRIGAQKRIGSTRIGSIGATKTGRTGSIGGIPKRTGSLGGRTKRTGLANARVRSGGRAGGLRRSAIGARGSKGIGGLRQSRPIPRGSVPRGNLKGIPLKRRPRGLKSLGSIRK